MEQTRFIKTIIRHARYFLIALFLALPSIVHAAPAQFFYDDLGRLNSVIDETGNGVTYNYDAVGNLLSIVPIGPPTITSVTPSILDAGRSVEVTIAGNGLVGTLTTSNPEIVISKADAMSTSLIATLTIPNPTTFGTTTLTVNTPKGSASINITVRQLLPTITSLTPSSGVAGDTVVIQGQNLGTKTGSNQVTFSGPGGARLVASILNESLTRITTIAPAGVEPGPVTVDVGGLTSNGLLFEPLTLTGIVATATQGTPADTTLPSANIDQSIGLQGSLFTSGMKVIFSNYK